MRLAKFHIILGILLIAGQAWGATYYISPSGGAPNDGTSWAAAYTTIQAALDARTTAGTVFEISGGASGETYAPAATVTSKENCTIKGSQEVGHNGTVTISASGHASHTIRIDHDVDLYDLTITGSAGTNYQIASITGSRMVNGYRLKIISGARALYNAAGSTLNLYNSEIGNHTGTFNANGAGSTMSFYYCKLYNNLNLSIITGTTNLYNSLLFGYPGKAIDISGNNSQTGNIKNNILFANAATTNNAHIIANSSTNATVNESNNLLLPNPFNADNYNWSGVTPTTGIYTSPRFTSHRRTVKVYLGIDDYANLALFQSLAAYAQSKGFVFNISVDTLNVTAGNWALLAGYVASGHGVACHSRTHVNVTNANGVTMRGPADSTISIAVTTTDDNSDNWVGTVTAKISGVTQGTPLALTGTTTLANVAAYIEAFGAGWSASVHASATAASKAVCLADLTNEAISVSYTALLSTDRFWFVEAAEPKAKIEANIAGYTCKFFTPPYNATSETFQDWLKTDTHGFFTKAGTTPYAASSASNVGSYTIGDDYTSGTGTLAGAQIYELARWQAATVIGATNQARNTAAIMAWAGHIGAVLGIYDHRTVDFSEASWVLVLNEIANSGVVPVSANSVADYISAGTDIDGTGERFTRTLSDSSNHRLKAGSPARNAGTAVFTRAQYLANGGDAAGVTDIYGTAPDIGAYETYEEIEGLPGMPWLDDPWICNTTNAACYVQE